MSARPRFRGLLAAGLLLAAGGTARAADPSGPDTVPDAALRLDAASGGGTLRLSALGPRPVLLMPVFTHCRAVCGVMVQRLASAWGEAGLPGLEAPVVLISFDPEDTPEDLAHFRAMFRAPAAWKLASLEREEGLRFFSGLGFRWRTLEDRQFDHAGKLFVLDGGRRISAVLGPDQLTPERLSAEVEAARHGKTLARRIGTHWIGFFGVALVLASLAAAAGWNRLSSGRVLPRQ